MTRAADLELQDGGVHIRPEGMTLQEFLSAYSDQTKQAALDLMRDQRVSSLWGVKFRTRDFEDAVHVFELANTRRPWDSLSRRQQGEWLDQFDKAVGKLLDLMKTAPCPPEDAEHAPGWSIVEELLAFAAQQHVGATIAQPLAKPGDAKAPRAYFLAELQRYRPNLSAAVVATVASVMFGEEVDDRKAREHRPDGFSGSRKNPS